MSTKTTASTISTLLCNSGIRVQTSDNIARFDEKGNSINPEPKTSFMFPLDLVAPAQGANSSQAPASQQNSYSSNDWAKGHSCPACSVWIANGIHHSCGQNLLAQLTFPRIELRPHKCPVCEGKSHVPFNPDDPLSVSRDKTSWPCKPCSGTGVLWQ